MKSAQRMFHSVVYRYGWDTRCRNLIPARLLGPVLADMPPQVGPVLLDVGSGSLGIGTFLPGVSVVGTDVERPAEPISGFTFHQGNITALPFPDKSFPVVTCIDVLEHLSLADRERAIDELVRVAARTVLIACPHGQTAQACDEEYRQACQMHGRPLPDWVSEHQRQPYPVSSTVVERIREAAGASGRAVKISQSYCEPAGTCRFVRAVAARSNVLYIATNLLCGVLFPLIPAPDAESSYRVILLAELSSDGSGASSDSKAV